MEDVKLPEKESSIIDTFQDGFTMLIITITLNE